MQAKFELSNKQRESLILGNFACASKYPDKYPINYRIELMEGGKIVYYLVYPIYTTFSSLTIGGLNG